MNQQPNMPPAPSWQPVSPPAPSARPAKKRHRWPWVVAGAVVAIFVVAGITGQRDTPQTSQPAATSLAPIAPAAPAPQQQTTTVQPTTTVPPAPPVVKSGRGDDVIAIERPGVKIVKFECPRCTSNTIVETDGAESLLVNTIGKYSGQHWVDIRDGSTTSTYTIKAKGAWTLTVGGLEMARAIANGPVTGKGDDVVVLNHNSNSAAITNKGAGNFIMQVVSLDTLRIDLAVNEIGGYSGTVPLDGPAIVQVNSEGSWSITPR
jgi:hypothetical protein